MLILKLKLSVFLQYFPSKISTSTEESVQLEALVDAGGCIDASFIYGECEQL